MLNKIILFYNLIPYKGIRYYSSVNDNLRSVEKLDPYFVTGLTEAEGSFSIRKNKDSRAKDGLTLGLRFKITMLSNELTLLNQVHSYFGVGKIYVSEKGVVDYVVQDIESLKIIQDHFERYPLRGTKHQDFLDFSKVLNLMINKLHNTYEVKMTIVDISNGMNSYRKEFIIPKHTTDNDPDYTSINGHYINGFIAGDGSLFLKTKTNFASMGIQISQHKNNIPLIKEIANYFNPTIPIVVHGKDSIQITISGDKLWKDIISKHFLEYPLYGSKSIQLAKLNEIAMFKQSGKHLTKVDRTRIFSKEAKDLILSIWNK